jgi:hypothetical protein
MNSLELAVVATLPGESINEGITADGHHAAIYGTPEAKLRFSWDGALGEPFDDIAIRRDKAPATYASDDGCHIAYVGIRRGMPFVGRDGGEDPPIADLSFSVPPTFDMRGRHLAYGARLTDEGPTEIVVDGVAREGMVAPIAPVFSSDGSRFAYAQMRGSGQKDYEVRIVLDDVPGPWFRALRNASGALKFSPDARRFAYYMVDGAGKARWIVDDAPQRWINDVRPLGLAQLRGIGVLDPELPAAFSPDSKRFAYCADVLEKGVAMLEDDVAGPVAKQISWPVFSPDSSRLAYSTLSYSATVELVTNASVIGTWNAKAPGHPVFSPDSGHLAMTFAGEEGGLFRKRQLASAVIDDRAFAWELADDASIQPTWSADGRRLAWWIRQGGTAFVVLDGIVQRDAPRPMSDIVCDAAGRFLFAGAVGEGQTVVADGRPGPTADALTILRSARDVFGREPREQGSVPFRLSPDGPHVAWAARFGTEIRPVYDDEVGPAFDEIIDCQFDEAGSVTWWGRRGQELIRATLRTTTSA